MGRPSLVEPRGRDIAGLPVALLSGVKHTEVAQACKERLEVHVGRQVAELRGCVRHDRREHGVVVGERARVDARRAIQAEHRAGGLQQAALVETREAASEAVDARGVEVRADADLSESRAQERDHRPLEAGIGRQGLSLGGELHFADGVAERFEVLGRVEHGGAGRDVGRIGLDENPRSGRCAGGSCSGLRPGRSAAACD